MHKFLAKATTATSQKAKYYISCDTQKKNNCSYLKANYAIVNIIRHKDVCIKYCRSLAVETSSLCFSVVAFFFRLFFFGKAQQFSRRKQNVLHKTVFIFPLQLS